MKFSDLDSRMRLFEKSHDVMVMPGIHMIVRLDGRNFTTLTKQMAYSKPVDPMFCNVMVSTAVSLFTAGFKVIYGYTQSDEISLLLARDDETFGRKERKINSVLAGFASAHATLLVGQPVAFDSRVCQLPNPDYVLDYFSWRIADAERNALHGACYWKMRHAGRSAGAATRLLDGLSRAQKHDLLMEYGTNFNDLPVWQKRGVPILKTYFQREGFNPITGKTETAVRSRIEPDFEAPMRQDMIREVSRRLMEDSWEHV